MVDLLTHENETIRERTCMALTAIACLADGKDAIVKNFHMLVNLAHAVDDVDAAVRIKASCCIEMCSRSWMGIKKLIQFHPNKLLLITTDFFSRRLFNRSRFRTNINRLHLQRRC